MRELLADGYIPSFCTACYRLGRTGEHFMEFAIPGFIQNLCTPNALTHADGIPGRTTPRRRPAPPASRLIEQELAKMPEGQRKEELLERLRRIRRATRGICISE